MQEPVYLQNPHLDGGPFAHEGGPVGALLIHGYTATTAEVRLLGDELARRGFSVAAPLLPGHGTSPDDLARCRWQDWADHVESFYAQLAARCARVYAIGESLGALLALHLAAHQPDVAGVVPCAPALIARTKLIHLSPVLKHVVKQLPKRRGEAHPDSLVDRRWQGYNVDVTAAAAQLLALQRVVRRELPLVRQPALICQGRLDTSIDLRGAEVIYAEIGSAEKELVWYERSTHCLMLDVELAAVAERIASVMRHSA